MDRETIIGWLEENISGRILFNPRFKDTSADRVREISTKVSEISYSNEGIEKRRERVKNVLQREAEDYKEGEFSLTITHIVEAADEYRAIYPEYAEANL